MTAHRVLVIEDDKDIALSLRILLERADFQATLAADGRDGLRIFHSVRPDLVILDVGLPEMDGWTVLERIRDLSDVAVLMLTAHGHEAEKVRGLRGGADDYMTKPFSNAELVARAQALLRRSQAGSPGESPEAEVFDDGSIEVNFVAHEVRAGGEVVELTPTEYRLLAALVRHQGQVLSAQTLLDLAWSDPFGIGPERVKYAVMRLRRKLAAQEETGDSPIEAVRGFGYRYRASPGQHQRGSPPRPADSSPGRYGPLTPATGPHPASHAVATAAGHAMAMTPTAATRGRILLVEDDPDAATFFRDVLTGRDDYQVTHTADPAQALCLAERQPWDLLLTDFHLPGMTGLELLIAVRLVRPALPVVIVTADDPGLLRLPCGSPDALLHKPVPAGFLLSTVATLLARHRTAEPGSRTPGGASAPST